MPKHRPLHIHPNNSIIFITARIYGGFSYLKPKKTKDYFWKLIKSKSNKYSMLIIAKVVLNNHYHLLLEVSKGENVSKLIGEIHGASAHYINENLPSLITKFGQVLTKEITPWDKRYSQKISKLERELTQNLSKQNTLIDYLENHKDKIKPKTYQSVLNAVRNKIITDPKIVITLTTKKRPVWNQYVDHVIRNEIDFYRHINYIHQNPVKHKLVKNMSKYKWSSIHDFIKEKGKEWVLGCFETYPIVDFQPEGIVD